MIQNQGWIRGDNNDALISALTESINKIDKPIHPQQSNNATEYTYVEIFLGMTDLNEQCLKKDLIHQELWQGTALVPPPYHPGGKRRVCVP